jgi:dihydroorotase
LTQNGAIPLSSAPDFASLAPAAVIDAAGATIVPAGIDVHVHSRDPGLTQKETWDTLALGAYRGGVVAVADMPNTLPPTMTREAVLAKAARARASGLEFRLLLGVGAANIGQVGALLADPELPLCALKVFYGRTTGELLYDDLETLARSLPASGEKPVVFHSEDQCTVDCNQARLGDRLSGRANADFAVHSEIRSSAAAHASTRKVLEWARTVYRRPIHIAHVSTPLEVELVAEAKARGVPVTCEVAPHHLLLSTDDYGSLGPLAKMNPPLRSPEEVAALRRLVGKGEVDLFATDHAPHLLAEKRVDVAHSPSGVPSLELFWPLILAIAEITGLAPETACTMAAERPAALFGFRGMGRIAAGCAADFAWLAREPSPVRGQEVVSKCGWTPYDGATLPGRVLGTWTRGRRVFAPLAP